MKNRLIFYLLSSASAIILLVVLLNMIAKHNINSNGKVKPSDSIARVYTKEEIESLRHKIETSSIDYAQFQSDYGIEQKRETSQGGYIVLVQDDGSHAFIFLNEENKLTKLLVFDEFKTEEDFSFVVPNQTTESEILDFDENAIVFPFSSKSTIAYILQDGVIVFSCRWATDGVIHEDPIVESVLFVDNQSIPEEENYAICARIPYILEEDKQWK